MNIYEEIIKAATEPLVIATVVKAEGSTPRKAGAKMLYKKTGKIIGTIGGGQVEQLVIEQAKKVLETNTPCLVSYDLRTGGTDSINMVCGGRMEIFLEPLQEEEKIYIFGAGHVGAAMCQQAKLLGFYVVILDERPQVVENEKVASADELIIGNILEQAENLKFNPYSYLIILTSSHQLDKEILKRVLPSPARYIGMIGSKKKIRMTFESLKKEGISPLQLKKVFTPIGLPIGGQTPEEIAVSIMAEIIAFKYGIDFRKLVEEGKTKLNEEELAQA